MNATAMKTQIAKPTVAAQRAARPARQSVVVRATAEESRRAVLTGFVAGAAALAVSAMPATAIDVIDDRKARNNGFDLIYEARDLDLPQNVRDGLTQARQDLAATKKRIAESEKRIDTLLPPAVSKAYWTEAREELRRQVGNLRFDINAVAETLPKDARKALLQEKKEFFALVEELDLALVKKQKEDALAKLPAVQSKLDSVIAKLG